MLSVPAVLSQRHLSILPVSLNNEECTVQNQFSVGEIRCLCILKVYMCIYKYVGIL